MKKGIIITIIVVVVAAIGGYYLFGNTGKKNQISYVTVAVGRSDISNRHHRTCNRSRSRYSGIGYHRQDICRLQLGRKRGATYRRNG